MGILKSLFEEIEDHGQGCRNNNDIYVPDIMREIESSQRFIEGCLA